MNVYDGSRSFSAAMTIITTITALNRTWRVDDPHDRREDDLATGESQPRSSDAEDTLSSEHFFTREGKVNKVRMHVHRTCF